MRGWYVDKDTGRPLAFTRKGNKPDLETQKHPFITEPMPVGHDPRRGKFLRWTVRGWETDVPRETQWTNEKNDQNQEKQDARTAFQAFMARTGPVLEADRDDLKAILRRLKTILQ